MASLRGGNGTLYRMTVVMICCKKGIACGCNVAVVVLKEAKGFTDDHHNYFEGTTEENWRTGVTDDHGGEFGERIAETPTVSPLTKSWKWRCKGKSPPHRT